MASSDASTSDSWWYQYPTQGTAAWPGMITWITPTAPRTAEPPKPGWKCGACGLVLAPHVDSHRCPEDGGLLTKDGDACNRCAGREVRGPGDDCTCE